MLEARAGAGTHLQAQGMEMFSFGFLVVARGEGGACGADDG